MFVVKGKRNSRNFDKVTTLDRTAYKKTNGDWQPVEVDSTADILQLSYENFRRTIIIPQGKFQEFLELTDTERTRMMKELFHLQKFELSENVSRLEQKANEQRIRLEERIQQTGVVTAAEISVKENELNRLREQLKSYQQVITEKKTAEQLFSHLKRQFQRIAEQREVLHLLQQQEPEMTALEQRINKYEFCMLHFKPLFDRRNELQLDAAKQEVALDQQKQMLVQTQEALADKEKEYPLVRQAFENRLQLKEKSAELQKIIQWNLLQQDRKVISGRMEKGMVFLQETEQDIAALQQQQDTLTEKIKEQKNNLPDLMVISAISNWFVQKNALLSAMQNTMQEVNTVKEKLIQLSAKRKAVFTPALRKLIPEVNVDEPRLWSSIKR